MIFVTIGSLFPFDRLIRATDELALTSPNRGFFAQIGDGAYEPKNMPFVRILNKQAFAAKVSEASVIVAHAGMGSVITAMERAKPIVLLPRRFELGEHNTDHQMATARWLEGKPGIHVCMHETEIPAALGRALKQPHETESMERAAPAPFLNKLRDYIASA